MKKFIYLDIDGVICLANASYKRTEIGDFYSFDQKAVDVLNNILRETDADIIISSDWKYHFSLKQLQEIFVYFKIIKAPIGCTEESKNVKFIDLEKIRAQEILNHVKQHSPDYWVVLDDLDLDLYIGSDHFVHLPRFYEGIKQTSKKDKIIKILN